MSSNIQMSMVTYFENYTPVGDVIAMALCLVFVVLIMTSYISRTKSFLYIKLMILFLFLSAFWDIQYHVAADYIRDIPVGCVYFLRILYHMSLFAIMLLFVFYADNMLHLDDKEEGRFLQIGIAGYIILTICDIIGADYGEMIYLTDNIAIHTGFPIFPFGYLFFVIIVIHMVAIYRDRVYKQIVIAIAVTTSLCVLIITIQQLHGQSAFTVSTFGYPIYALLFMVHANPYNIESGALSKRAFDDYIRSSTEHKRKFLLMSLYMHEFDVGSNSYPKEILATIRFFVIHFFRSAKLFQVTGGHLIMAIDVAKNPEYDEMNKKMIGEFNRLYPMYQRDYKIVRMMNDDYLGINNDYVEFIEYIHGQMQQNSLYRVEEADIKRYKDYKYIIEELHDINEKKDLHDPRVEVFCQPVFNIKRGVYDTAEALMRLRLPETGMVFPDIFIPIAEKNGYINILTKILLNKTCAQVNDLMRRGYNVRRISVNFSIFDVRDNDFCSIVQRIIRENGIPNEKIAIEITESQNESDFEVIKERITELKGSGIKFYLDDFGTGYSNFERIMELPFDIIKFDRSLVIASSNDEKMRDMVTHLAKMFADMDYAILYEGIEDEADEARCKDMSAKYLQGYKYSKPIPIKELTDYFEKSVG